MTKWIEDAPPEYLPVDWAFHHYTEYLPVDIRYFPEIVREQIGDIEREFRAALALKRRRDEMRVCAGQPPAPASGTHHGQQASTGFPENRPFPEGGQAAHAPGRMTTALFLTVCGIGTGVWFAALLSACRWIGGR